MASAINFSLVASSNPANLRLFKSLQTFFWGWSNRKEDSKNVLRYKVTDLLTLLKIRDHFNYGSSSLYNGAQRIFDS